MNDLIQPLQRDALEQLRDAVPRVIDALVLEEEVDLRTWRSLLDNKLLPRVSGDFPVVAAICGGGSSGKSTLFNALADTPLSPTGGRAGINRRILAAGHPEVLGRENLQRAIFDPLGDVPEFLENTRDLCKPGGPLVVHSERIPRQLVLLDTPDFDTGAKGEYINREVTRQALEASDILIYIFTNSNYNLSLIHI